MQALKPFNKLAQIKKAPRGAFFVFLATFFLLLYFVAAIALYFFQNRLIFPGAESNTANINYLKQHYPETEVSFNFDSAILHGWHFNKKSHKPIIFYYGGNADELSNAAMQFAPMESYQSIFVNYRGYGMSTGTPSEEKIYNDSLKIFDYFIKEEQPDKIIVMGRSLGTGVATYVASQRKPDGLILVTPFDSITAIGQSRYPFFPVQLMIRQHFDSISRAEKLTMPTLVLIAENDSVVPYESTQRLLNKLPVSPEVKVLKQTNHGNIVNDPSYLPVISDFLQKTIHLIPE